MHAEQSTSYSGFVHDDWRVDDRRTLNLRIRYEAEGALRKRWKRSWGGWQLQGIYTYQSGRPIPITSGGMIVTGNFADLHLDKPTVEKWFNTANFNTVSNRQLVSNVRTFPLRFSNLRFDDLSTVDFSVIKGTAITENVNLQFRPEALNAFNSPNFGAVDVNPTSANFGRVTAVNNYARRIQSGLRLVF